jgi:uncharacterized protein (TIGR03437 family)
MRLRQTTQAGALRVLHLQPYADGLPVYGSSARVAIDDEGRVRLATFAEPAPGVRLKPDFGQALSVAEAVRAALLSLGVEAGERLQALAPSHGRSLFAHPEGSSRLPVAAEPVAFPMPGGQALSAWRVFADAGAGSYETLVAADDGRVLLRRNLVSEAGSGRVFDVTPLSPSVIRQFQQSWLAPEATVTTGNNIDAYADTDADDAPDNFDAPGLLAGRAYSPAQAFDFDPGTGGNAGRATRAAAVTNVFYHGNRAHDLFYELGFREAEGNFQQDNGDRGGLGGDRILIEVHDPETLNNARYTSRPDGLSPRIEMGLWLASATTVRDFALDATAIIHEYAHGVTTRAIGGPDNVSCLSGFQGGGLGEGWSDFFGSSMLDAPVFGDYISGDHGNGIRGAAIDKNTKGYADFGAPIFQVHRDGTIWASTLWDIRNALGKAEAEALIVRALLVTPCSPTYVDARDAILAADGGGRRRQLWSVFAARGLGFAASASHSNAAVGTVFNASSSLPPDLGDANRAPQITSRPTEPAVIGQPYSYTVRSVDLDGDSRTYELVSGPAGAVVDATTGEMRWPSPTFTAHRIQIAVSDGKGGRTLHGFQLRVDADLSLGQPVLISGAAASTGLAYFDVPEGAEILQVRLRGDNGDADLILFRPDFTTELSVATGSNETLSILDPEPGEWVARVDARGAYRDVAVSANLVVPTDLSLPGDATGLSEARTGEQFFKFVVPPNTPLVRATLVGKGDADLLLAKGRVPLCSFEPTSLDCDEDESSFAAGPYELISLENLEPGDYFVTVYAFRSYRDVTLEVSLTAPSAQPGAVTDGAAFLPAAAPGGIASLFGQGLSEVTEQATSLPLPKELGGVRVIVGGIETALFFVSPTQINFLYPGALTIGSSARVYVLRNGELSDSIRASQRLAAPQIFVNPSARLPIIAHADGSLVTAENPLRPGETIVVYFTGIGLVSSMPPDGEAASASPLSQTLLRASATLGGQSLTVLFAGLTPGFVGLAQANLTLPATLAAGATLPLVLSLETDFLAFRSAAVDAPVAP